MEVAWEGAAVTAAEVTDAATLAWLAGEAEATISATVSQPQLWWPNGQGSASLYTSILELLDEPSTSTKSVQAASERTACWRLRVA